MRRKFHFEKFKDCSSRSQQDLSLIENFIMILALCKSTARRACVHFFVEFRIYLNAHEFSVSCFSSIARFILNAITIGATIAFELHVCTHIAYRSASTLKKVSADCRTNDIEKNSCASATASYSERTCQCA